MKVEFEVPVEREVAVSVNRGVPIAISAPRSAVAKSLPRCRRQARAAAARPVARREWRPKQVPKEGLARVAAVSHPGRGADGTEVEPGQESGKPAPERSSVVSDPFADLKTRVHKDIIARLGPRLFNADQAYR